MSNTRGKRSNFYETICLDTYITEKPHYVWKRIDKRVPIDRYIPVYYLQDCEFLKRLDTFKKYYERHPIEFAEMILGRRMKCWQKLQLVLMSKVNKYRI